MLAPALTCPNWSRVANCSTRHPTAQELWVQMPGCRSMARGGSGSAGGGGPVVSVLAFRALPCSPGASPPLARRCRAGRGREEGGEVRSRHQSVVGLVSRTTTCLRRASRGEDTTRKVQNRRYRDYVRGAWHRHGTSRRQVFPRIPRCLTLCGAEIFVGGWVGQQQQQQSTEDVRIDMETRRGGEWGGME